MISKVGLVIADDSEYAPVAEYLTKKGGEEVKLINRSAVKYTAVDGSRSLDIIAIYCGIGKVNAATVTAYLLATKQADLIVNCGLSGGFNSLNVGDVVVGTGFVEHDFDLSAIGYKPGQKPGQDYFYYANKHFTDDFKSKYPCKSGVMVSGDCFVSDDKKAKELIEQWDAVSCDMESAAIASVCHDFDIPFVSIRRISDGADNAGGDTYQSTIMDKQTWMTVSVKWIESLL